VGLRQRHVPGKFLEEASGEVSGEVGCKSQQILDPILEIPEIHRSFSTKCHPISTQSLKIPLVLFFRSRSGTHVDPSRSFSTKCHPISTQSLKIPLVLFFRSRSGTHVDPSRSFSTKCHPISTQSGLALEIPHYLVVKVVPSSRMLPGDGISERLLHGSVIAHLPHLGSY
jgi:hypothetical protein